MASLTAGWVFALDTQVRGAFLFLKCIWESRISEIRFGKRKIENALGHWQVEAGVIMPQNLSLYATMRVVDAPLRRATSG